MKRLIFLLMFLILLSYVDSGTISSCRISDTNSCGGNEKLMFYVYPEYSTQAGSHVSINPSNVNNQNLTAVCCTVSNLNIIKGEGSCSNLDKTLFKAFSDEDSHVAMPWYVDPVNIPKNICLSESLNDRNSVTCTVRNPDCLAGDNPEVCVIGIYSGTDADNRGGFHVAQCGTQGYDNKVCCKNTICPEGFEPDPREPTGCRPIFDVCLEGTCQGGTTPDESGRCLTGQEEELRGGGVKVQDVYATYKRGPCRDLWKEPNLTSGQGQQEPYWRDADALDRDDQDCFTPSITQACYYKATLNNILYGEYQDIKVKKTKDLISVF